MTPPVRTKPTKAILGAAGALLSGLTTGLADGHLTLLEVLLAVGLAVASAGAVYGVTNEPYNDGPA